MTRMEELINELKGTQRAEDTYSQNLHSEILFQDVLQVREEVKNIEAERKEKFQEKIPEQIRRASYAR